MKKPGTIINTSPSDYESWGSYTKENGWSNKVYSGKAIREWIQGKFKKTNLYGPYESLDEVYDIIEEGDREIGLTVGIYNEDHTELYEYWFQLVNGELELVEKTIPLNLKQVKLTVSSPLYINDGYLVTLSYAGIGRIIGGQVLFYRDNAPIGNLQAYTTDGGRYIINSETIGTHEYKVVITDSIGNKTEDSKLINVGIIQIIEDITLNLIRSLSKITLSTIESLGNSFKISIKKLTDESNINVVIVDSENNILYTFIGLDDTFKEFVIDLSELDIEGKELFIKAFRGNEEVYSRELFRVLSSSTLFVSLQGNKIPTFVLGVPQSVYFIFESGADSLTIDEGTNNEYFSWTYLTPISFDKTGKALISIRLTPLKISTNGSIIYFNYGENKSVSLNLGNIEEKYETTRSIEWNFNLLNSLNINSCFIDFTSEFLYPTDEEFLIKFNDKMWITNDVIHVNNIEVATPLYEDEPVYIGLGYGVSDENPNLLRPDPNFVYDCICINGTIVKISENDSEKFSRDTLIDWNIGANIDKNLNIKEIKGNKCRGLLYKTKFEGKLNLIDNNTFIFESHYKEDFELEEENNNIATLTLKALGTYGNLDNKWDKNYFRNIKFGTIEDGFSKYVENSFETWNSNPEITPILFKISTSLKEKKKVLKKWGVVCSYTYTSPGKAIKTGTVIVYSQGTSTLQYPIPNLRLNFQNNDNFELRENLSENYLTAKADYMESAHLNNTPLAMLYNRVMKSDLILEKSPAILNNLYDAIEGIPVIIKILDIGSSEINLGSFMLNTDKNSNSMGFEINGYSDCMSLEGHSNELSETSARFNYGYGTNGDSLTEESLYTNGNLDLSKVITFLKKGLEERYLGSDSEDEYWMRFYNDYWKKIELGENIEDIVSIDYCCIYIIFLMVFAMSDNVGKNCMFDIWKDSDGNWGKIFPRFYDLDSSCGLTNGGLLNVLPFALVDKGWIPESIREEAHNKYGTLHNLVYKYINNQEMYLYSSNDSKLWNYIFNTYRDTRIATMYSNLRDSFLSYDYLINFFKEIIIDVIPVSQYNLDFLNKYLRTNYQEFMYGNRWTNFKDWLRARLSFCDSLFKYKNNAIEVGNEVTISLKYMFPSYLCITTAGLTERWDFGYEPLVSGGGNAVNIYVSLSDYIVTNTTMFSSPLYTRWKLVTHPYEFNNLLKLSLGGGVLPDLSKCINLTELELTKDCSITSINVPQSVKKLSRIAFVGEYFTPSSIRINIPDNSSLEEIELHYINITEVLDLATKCPNLKVLKLYNCNINQLIFPNSTISFTAEGCTFSNITVNSETILTSLELNNLTIETFNLAGIILRFDLFNSTIPTELHLESVEGIESLNLIKSNVKKVIVGNKTFSNTLKLGLLESELEVFKKNTDSGDIVNLDIFLNINVTSILNYKDKGTPIIQSINTLKYISGQYKGSSELDALDSSLYLLQYSGLSFGNTKIKKVISSRITSSLINGTAMFALCSKLTEISCTNSTTFSSDWIFYDCPELTTLTNVKINKFKGAFVGDSIAYSKIKDTIDNKATNADFSYFMCLYLKSGETIVINDGDYPTLYGVYKMFNKPNDTEFTRKNGRFARITINAPFKLANSCTDISHMFCGNSDNLTKIEVNTSGENIFNDYSKITKAEGTFYGCSVSNINLLNKLTNVINVNSMYAYSTITNQSFVNDKITLTNTQIGDLHCLFYLTTFNNVGTIIIDEFIKSIPTPVIDLDSCFFNCLNNSKYPIVKISNSLLINNSTTEVYINGIIGVSSLSNSDVFTKVVWDEKLKLRGTSSKGPRTSRTNINALSDLGPFAKRRTTTSSITLGSSIKKNLDFYCYLYGVVGPNEGLNVSIKYPGNISYMCCNASNIRILDISSLVLFDAKGAFRQCNFKDSTTNKLPSNILDNVKNADEMFAGSNLYQITFALSNTITSVISMFNLCYQLRNGLPTDFYSNAPQLTNFTRIFYGTSIAIVNSDYQGLIYFLPEQTTIADGAFACTRTKGQNESGKDLLIIIKCPNLRLMAGIFAASQVDFHFDSVNDSQLDLSYAFTFRDYNPSDIGGILNRINNGYAMYAKWDNSDDSIPSNPPEIPNSEGMWYGWIGNTDSQPVRNTYYYHPSIISYRDRGTFYVEAV